LSNKGYHHTEKWKKERSKEMKGNKNGIGHIISSENRKKMIKGLRKLIASNDFHGNMYGKHFTDEHRKKLSESHKGQIPWIKGRHHSLESKEKMKISMKGNKNHLGHRHSEETKRIIGEKSKEMWGNPEFIKKVTDGWHTKTKPERQLDSLLQTLYPREFTYNGDYSAGISLDGLIPDFVNINGKKQVVEMFGDYWHKYEEIEEKTERYAKIGFSSLFIWESELKNIEEIIRKIVYFIEKEPRLFF